SETAGAASRTIRCYRVFCARLCRSGPSIRPLQELPARFPWPMKLNLYDTCYFFDELFESCGRVRPEGEPSAAHNKSELMKTQRGLFSPGQTRGACGVGVLVDLNGTNTHQ